MDHFSGLFVMKFSFRRTPFVLLLARRRHASLFVRRHAKRQQVGETVANEQIKLARRVRRLTLGQFLLTGKVGE